MIYLFYGENEFEKRAALTELIGGENVERHDGESLSLNGMQEIVIGQTLFMDSSRYLISRLSENNEAWSQLPDMKFDEDRTIILVEDKIDKRTKTYKWLQKNAQAREFLPLSERQKPQLLKWCRVEAKNRGYDLTNQQAEIIVGRLGFDQLRLSNFLDQLALAEDVTDELIDDFIPLARAENVFDLFVSALAVDRDKVHDIIGYLESESGIDGAYQTMGLVASQVTNLTALILADGDSGVVASDFSVNPYVLRRLASLSKGIDKKRLRRINEALFRADLQMKTTSVNPWLLIEAALVDIG
jgi:hypothetical protein